MKENIEQRIENYWDKRSRDFSAVRKRELLSENMPLWRELLLRRLPKGRLKILDAGTGAGFFAIILAKSGYDVTGIDTSGKMVEESKKNAAEFGVEVEFLKMPADKLEFPDNLFDAVVSRNLTWTLPDCMEAYRVWRRVLKPDGRILNYDSDMGEISFSRKEDINHVHSNLSQQEIDECNSIKKSLRISTHKRPSWDKEFLESIRFNVEITKDISCLVRKDKNIIYDDLPMFEIYAEKI
ncbi:MAG: class I SAM-dependent methyltransferase [Selenomonadaceae bacterium]|nr:class I SAM-dependent methyltransferase [Selenomonadaceae bacterium]